MTPEAWPLLAVIAAVVAIAIRNDYLSLVVLGSFLFGFVCGVEMVLRWAQRSRP